MKAYSIANAGVLLQTGGQTLVMDGLYDMPENPFWPIESLSDAMVSHLVDSASPLGKIDCLLFTHCHQDHFNWDLVCEAVQNGRVGSIVVPYDAQNYDPNALARLCAAHGVRLHFLTREAEALEENGVRLRFLKTAHLNETQDGTPHYSLLASDGARTVFFSGDIGGDAARVQKFTGGKAIDLAFFVFFHFNKREGRAMIRTVNPRRCVLYHLPYGDDAMMHVRALSQKTLLRYKDELPPVQMPARELEEITIGGHL